MRNKTNEVTDFSEIASIIARCDTIGLIDTVTAKRAMPKKDTPDYKVMQFQGEVRSPHM